jgi:hypothetical protein
MYQQQTTAQQSTKLLLLLLLQGRRWQPRLQRSSRAKPVWCLSPHPLRTLSTAQQPKQPCRACWTTSAQQQQQHQQHLHHHHHQQSLQLSLQQEPRKTQLPSPLRQQPAWQLLLLLVLLGRRSEWCSPSGTS